MMTSGATPRSTDPHLVLGRFTTFRPRFDSSQEATLSWLAYAHTRAEMTKSRIANCDATRFHERITKLIQRCCCDAGRIARRGHELPDFTHTRWQDMAIYDVGQFPEGRGMEARTRFFADAVDEYFTRAYDDGARAGENEGGSPERFAEGGDSEPPSDLVHVTCTGYVSPSGAQKLVARRGWGAQTRVTHAYHMGCYAALPALRIAAGFTGLRAPFAARGAARPSRVGRQDRHARVDICHTELCSLHLNPSLHSAEQLVVQSLFADGYIRYSLVDDDSSAAAQGLRLLALNEAIMPDSEASMSWRCANWGLAMTLGRDVPARISASARAFVFDMCARAGISDEARDGSPLLAVHPGGPRVLDVVRDTLGAREDQLRFSRKVLREYGNMSSATLPHIWQEIVEAADVPSGALVVSLAFGPGLTMCGALLRKR